MSDAPQCYVYVLEMGEYSNAGIIGVYDSPTAAMAEFPKDRWTMDSDAEPGLLWVNNRRHENRRTIMRYRVAR